MDAITLAVYGIGWWLWQRHQNQQAPAPAPEHLDETAPDIALVPVPSVWGNPAPVETIETFVPTAPVILAPSVDGQGLTAIPAFPSQTYTPSPRPILPSTTPQERGFQLSDQMLAKFSQKTVAEIMKWFDSPVQTHVNISPESAEAWQAYKAGERGDYSAWTKEQTPEFDSVSDFSPQGNADAASTVDGAMSATTSAGEHLVSAVAGDVALTLADGLTAVAIVGALVDIGFTIASDQPDAQKAVNAALDAALIVCLFIPVWGWVIAIVIVVVKLVLNLFGSEIFGGDDHKMREAREANRAMSQASDMARAIAEALSPRELVRVLWRWTTLYCGGPLHAAGNHAILTSLQGADGAFYFAPNPCYLNGGRYHEWPDAAVMTLDDQALALVQYAASEFHVSIQAGVKPEMLAGGNWSLDEGVTKKCLAWQEIMSHGITLDQLDLLATEHRKQPRLREIAEFFGAPSWYDLIGWHLQDLWTRYLIHSRSGSLSDFAHQFGHPTWISLRDSVSEQYGIIMDRCKALAYQVIQWGTGPNGTTLRWPFPPLPEMTPSEAIELRLEQLDAWIASIAQHCTVQKTVDLQREAAYNASSAYVTM